MAKFEIVPVAEGGGVVGFICVVVILALIFGSSGSNGPTDKKPSKNNDVAIYNEAETEKTVYGNVVDLKDLSINNQNGSISFCESAYDDSGKEHKNIWKVYCYGYGPEFYISIPDGFSSFSGTIYAPLHKDDMVVSYKDVDAWLEFYDGRNCLYSTQKVGFHEGLSSTSFSFDIQGVSSLKVICRAENTVIAVNDYMEIIGEDLQISR